MALTELFCTNQGQYIRGRYCGNVLQAADIDPIILLHTKSSGVTGVPRKCLDADVNI